jgi:hypothetical protein
VTPLGDLIATPERGLVYGNRGCLHDEQGVIRRRYATRRWIACQLHFRGRRRASLMARGRYTELFFLDEATALSAGHRPCAECRRADYNRLVEIWSSIHPGQSGADDIDDQLHSERLSVNGERRLHESRYSTLPDGAFTIDRGIPHVVSGPRLLVWSPGGYLSGSKRPRRATAAVITPPSLLAALDSDWAPLVPLLHPSATTPVSSPVGIAAGCSTTRVDVSSLRSPPNEEMLR